MFKSISTLTTNINQTNREIEECTKKINQFGQKLTCGCQIKTQLSELLSSLKRCNSEY